MTKVNISSAVAQQYDVNANGNDYHLIDEVTIYNGEYGIYEAGTSRNNSFRIDGTVNGKWEGIRSYGVGTEIVIGQSGSVSSYTGIGLHGAKGHLVNDGSITGTGTNGVSMDSANGGSLKNAGSISGQTAGVNLYHGDFSVKNTGTISAWNGVGIKVDDADAKIVIGGEGAVLGFQGIDVENGDGHHVSVVNNGLIESSFGAAIRAMSGQANIINRGTVDGGIYTGAAADRLVNNGSVVYAIDLGGGKDVVTNSGTMSGSLNTGAGNDRIVNLGQASVIHGGAGNDFIDTRKGTSGALYGEDGNDTYLVSSTATAIVEKVGEGTDAVRSSATFTLSSYVENLTLTGKATINGSGNAEANRLTGNAGINQLYGYDGNDVLSGGKGVDHLSGGTGADTFIFSTGFGKDTVTDFEAGIDQLDFSHWKGMDSFADVMSHAKDTGDDLVFQFGKDSFTLEGVDKADLHKGDFQF